VQLRDRSTDAQAEVSVRLAEGGRSVTAKAPIRTRSLVAKAISALNKLMVRRARAMGKSCRRRRRIHSQDAGRRVARVKRASRTRGFTFGACLCLLSRSVRGPRRRTNVLQITGLCCGLHSHYDHPRATVTLIIAIASARHPWGLLNVR